MSNIQEYRFSAFANPRYAHIGARECSPVPDHDYHRLIAYHRQCDGSGEPVSVLLSHVIRHKLMTLKPVKNLDLADMVTGGRQLEYTIDRGPVQNGLLTHCARWEQTAGVIPAYSILGVTLIGMRAGQRAPLLCENGSVRSVTVLRVIQTI